MVSLARLFYVDGMNTMFAFGAVYARGTFEMSLEEVIMFAIAMNVTAGIGAASLGWIDDYLGSKKTIAIALGGLICFGIRCCWWRPSSGSGFWPAARPVHGACPGGQPVDDGAHRARGISYRDVRPFRFSGRATAYVGPFVLGTLTYVFDLQRVGMSTIVGFLAPV